MRDLNSYENYMRLPLAVLLSWCFTFSAFAGVKQTTTLALFSGERQTAKLKQAVFVELHPDQTFHAIESFTKAILIPGSYEIKDGALYLYPEKEFKEWLESYSSNEPISVSEAMKAQSWLRDKSLVTYLNTQISFAPLDVSEQETSISPVLCEESIIAQTPMTRIYAFPGTAKELFDFVSSINRNFETR